MSISVSSSLSVGHLIAQADLVVKSVVFILVLCSIVSWAIIWEKSKKMRGLWRDASRAFQAFTESSVHVPEVKDSSVFDQMIHVAQEEKRRLAMVDSSVRGMRLQRLQYLLSAMSSNVYGELSYRMGVLASIGSSAVFVGLFGTVWGIMNSFRSIAASQNTNLSVVAPGISEALFVTAAGLLVAIPAMVAYNRIMDSINRFMDSIDRFSQEILAWFSNE
jgi:biopolymer transport protein TolQ